MSALSTRDGGIWTGVVSGAVADRAGGTYIEGTSSGNTLLAEAGSLLLNGQALALNQSRSVDTGLITFVGQDVTFTVTNPGQTIITLDPGIITFSAPESYSTLALSIDPGTINFNGQAVDGVVTGPVTYTLVAEAGRINFNGMNVTLRNSADPVGGGGNIKTGIGIGVSLGF